MKTIKEYVADYFSPSISKRKKKCWQCKHFLKDGGKGYNGCDIDPLSFDNNWEYIPETYRTLDAACGYFELKEVIQIHLNKLKTQDRINNNIHLRWFADRDELRIAYIWSGPIFNRINNPYKG